MEMSFISTFGNKMGWKLDYSLVGPSLSNKPLPLRYDRVYLRYKMKSKYTKQLKKKSIVVKYLDEKRR